MKQRTRIIGIALFTLATLQLWAQNGGGTIVTIGNEKISRADFEANYLKNNVGISDKSNQKTPSEYLDMFVIFRLKVLEAKQLGYDTAHEYREELAGYREELAKPYLTDVNFNEEIVKKAYYRSVNERKASHLLVQLVPEAPPADTLAAWEKITGYREQILKGADFNEMAAKYSEDPSAVQNKGLLGYFAAFQMVYPFEDMAYRTPVGEVSSIVRSRFGYHIIKVHDERPSAGEIKVAHIMKMFSRSAGNEEIAKLKLEADSIWQQATTGADFATLAQSRSDDQQSALNGGEMKWFSRGTMVPEFADASFALKNDGDISPVTRTPYGWHIIKRLAYKPVGTFEEMRPSLVSKIRQNAQISKHSDEIFQKKLAVEYRLKINEDKVAKYIDCISDTSTWKKIGNNSAEQKSKLFSFAKRTYVGKQFYNYLLSQNYKPIGADSKSQVRATFDRFVARELLAHESMQLEKKHPDFARLYHEYRDGILLFNISKDKIWDVPTTDSLRLQDFYAHTTKKYYWGERFKGWIINADNIETRAQVETMLSSDGFNISDMKTVFGNKVETNKVECEKGENQIVDYFIWAGPKPVGLNETITFVSGEIVKNEEKGLKDAWGLYSSDFQEQLEKEWVGMLKKKYKVTINQKLLETIEKQYVEH